MGTITVQKNVDADPSAVWALLENFRDVSWIPVVTGTDVDGDGPGMRRTIHGTGDTPAVERLDFVDSAARRIGYEVEQSSLGFARITTVASVANSQDAGARASITFDVDYAGTGDDDNDRQTMELVYGVMLDWLKDAASANA